MKLAEINEVKCSNAVLYTVINGSDVEQFDIEIIETKSQSIVSSKGIKIKVTDSDLINETGGIVQGMSGSPIIQNGKLVGAVTHVFVSDPTKGYGVYADWMIDN